MQYKKTGYILGLNIGHNGGVCLLKDGEVVFAIEEERLSKVKTDSGPLLGMLKVLDYTDKVDYLVVSYVSNEINKLEYTGEPIYQAIARKLGLIETPKFHEVGSISTQYIEMLDNHHELHAMIAFHNSGFDAATAVVVDSAGSSIPFLDKGVYTNAHEIESIFLCERGDISPLFKKYGTSDLQLSSGYSKYYQDGNNNIHELIIDHAAGIGKSFDAVGNYCGFGLSEAGKTMGLSAFGKPNDNIPNIFKHDGVWSSTNKDLITPQYPFPVRVNDTKFESLIQPFDIEGVDITLEQNRRDLAYSVQKETQQEVLKLIIKSTEMTGQNNVVLSGGYALNCVSNYFYLEELKKLNINLYVEPNSSDAGTAMGAALKHYYNITNEPKTTIRNDNLFLGIDYNYSYKDLESTVKKYNGSITKVNVKEVSTLISKKNIVAIYQGRSENGPRALGHRSILFDPTSINGKDIVNKVKGREYFRPFASSVLEEYAHEWFDMRGLKESPNMMYAMDCYNPEKIPSVMHVDNTCRIQTVNRKQNKNYWNLIKEFYNQTKVPMLFNTSFNLAGEPLVETLEDSIDMLSMCEIEYCYYPEFQSLVKISNISNSNNEGEIIV
jgi:carbamoyltransferase